MWSRWLTDDEHGDLGRSGPSGQLSAVDDQRQRVTHEELEREEDAITTRRVAFLDDRPGQREGEPDCQDDEREVDLAREGARASGSRSHTTRNRTHHHGNKDARHL